MRGRPAPSALAPPPAPLHLNVVEDGAPSYPLMLTVTGMGRRGFADGHRLEQAYLDTPSDLCLLPDQSILFVDGKNNCLRRTTLDGDAVVSTLSTTPFVGPRCPILIDAGAAIVVCDSGHHKLRMLQFIREDGDTALDGRPLDFPVRDCPIVGCGRAGLVDGPADAAAFNRPVSLCILPDGSILVADSLNHAIRRVAGRPGKTGLYVTTVVGGSGVPGFADGDSTSARLRSPCSLTVDAFGAVLVGDGGNHAVRALHPPPGGNFGSSGWVLTTLVGGVAGYADGVASTAGRLREPIALAIGVDGELLIADAANNAVRALVAGGDLGPRSGMYAPTSRGMEAVVDCGPGESLDATIQRHASGNKRVLSLLSSQYRGASSAASHTVGVETASTAALRPMSITSTSTSGTAAHLATRAQRLFIVPPVLAPPTTTRTGGREPPLPWWANAMLDLEQGDDSSPTRLLPGSGQSSGMNTPSRSAAIEPDAALAAALQSLGDIVGPTLTPLSRGVSFRSWGSTSASLPLSAGGGGERETPIVTIAVYEHPERILATHHRYARLVTIAGPSPAMVTRGKRVGNPVSLAAPSTLHSGTTHTTSAATSALVEKMRSAAEVASEVAAINGFAPHADGAAVSGARMRRPSGLLVLPGAASSVVVSDASNHYLRLLVSRRAIDTQPPSLRSILTPQWVAEGRDVITAARVDAYATAGVEGSVAATGGVTVAVASPTHSRRSRGEQAHLKLNTSIGAVSSSLRSPTATRAVGAATNASLTGGVLPADAPLPPRGTGAPEPRVLPYGVAFGATVPPQEGACMPARGLPSPSSRAYTNTLSQAISTRRPADIPVRGFSPGGSSSSLSSPSPFTYYSPTSVNTTSHTAGSSKAQIGAGSTSSSGNVVGAAPRGRSQRAVAKQPIPQQQRRGQPKHDAVSLRNAPFSYLDEPSHTDVSRSGTLHPAGGSFFHAKDLLSRTAPPVAPPALTPRSTGPVNTGTHSKPSRVSAAVGVEGSFAWHPRLSALTPTSTARRPRSPTSVSASVSGAWRAESGGYPNSHSSTSRGVEEGVDFLTASSLHMGVPARVRFREQLGGRHVPASQPSVDSRTAIALEEAGAAGQVVTALLLSDVLASHAAAPGGGGNGSNRVTTADRGLITARFAQHTASSAATWKANGITAVRNAPAFVNVTSVVNRKMEQFRARSESLPPAPRFGGTSLPHTPTPSSLWAARVPADARANGGFGEREGHLHSPTQRQVDYDYDYEFEQGGSSSSAPLSPTLNAHAYRDVRPYTKCTRTPSQTPSARGGPHHTGKEKATDGSAVKRLSSSRSVAKA